MADIVTRYEDYLIEIKHASNNTVASYMRDIHQYASYLLELGSDVLDATQQTISEYVHWLQPEVAGIFWKVMERNVRQREVFQRIFPGSLKMEDGIISSPTAKPEKVKMVLQRKQPLMERNIILTKMVLCLPAGSV